MDSRSNTCKVSRLEVLLSNKLISAFCDYMSTATEEKKGKETFEQLASVWDAYNNPELGEV